MRLWSVHPRYLDSKGLLALWRESLLAQKVLTGGTRGYTKHSQLTRFKAESNPVSSVAAYLYYVYLYAKYDRKYAFDLNKIDHIKDYQPIPVTHDQVAYEFNLLRDKLAKRNPKKALELPSSITQDTVHPLFRLIPGPVEPWEKVKSHYAVK